MPILQSQITSHCRIKTAMEYAISRLDYHSRENWANHRWEISISHAHLWSGISSYPGSYRATSDAPEEPGGSGTFYFDIISYFTLKWDKWNCSLPSGVVLIFHRGFSSLQPLANHAGTRSNPASVVNMIPAKIKMFVSSIPLPTRERRY